jgi:hypothetical protein
METPYLAPFMYGGLLIEKKSFIKDRVFAPLNLLPNFGRIPNEK